MPAPRDIKHPYRVIVPGSGGYRLTVDTRPQRLSFDVITSGHGGRSSGYPYFRSVAEVLKQLPKKSAPFVSAAMLASKAQQVDRGIIATIDLAASRGLGRTSGMRVLLEGLLKAVAKQGSPVSPRVKVRLFFAAQLSGAKTSPSQKLARDVAKLRRRFMSNPFRWKPIGAYAWRPELIRLHQIRRLLQLGISSREASALRILLQRSAGIRRAYQLQLAVQGVLAGPPATAPLVPIRRGRNSTLQGNRPANCILTSLSGSAINAG